jgi:hypothetical protein
MRRKLNSIRVLILTLEEMVPVLPSLPDVSDADMALMYLRHLEKHLQSEIEATSDEPTPAAG